MLLAGAHGRGTNSSIASTSPRPPCRSSSSKPKPPPSGETTDVVSWTVADTAEYAKAVLNGGRKAQRRGHQHPSGGAPARRPAQVLDRAEPPTSWSYSRSRWSSVTSAGRRSSLENSAMRWPAAAGRIGPLSEYCHLPVAPCLCWERSPSRSLGDEENAVLYRESAWGDEIVHSSDEIGLHGRPSIRCGMSASVNGVTAFNRRSDSQRDQPGSTPVLAVAQAKTWAATSLTSPGVHSHIR